VAHRCLAQHPNYVAALAARGESPAAFNAIETGKFDPSLPLAFRAARLFGLRIEEIFHDEDRRSLATEIKKSAYV
jgi:putative transcriptional regulator